MADDTVKRLLIKLGISTTEFQSAVKEIKSQLDQLYQTEKVKAAARRASAQQDAVAQQKQLETTAKLTAAAQQQVAQIRQQVQLKQTTLRQLQEELTAEKSKLDVRTAQLKVLASEGVISGEALRTVEKQIAQERVLLSLRQSQIRAVGVSFSKEPKEMGLLGGALHAATKGIFGGGFGGSIATGALFGGLGAEAIAEGVGFLTEKFRELVKEIGEATGPAQTLRKEFEMLAHDKGADPSEAFRKLHEATHGLVEDSQLYSIATRLMRQDMNVSNDQITKLIGTTIDLARASGKSLPEAIQALSRAAATGQMRMLAFATGLNTANLQIKGLPASIDPAVRQTLIFNQVLAEEEKALRKLGAPALTLPELFEQLNLTMKNVIDDFAEGLLSSGKFGSTIQDLSKRLIELQPKLSQIARTLGEDVADAIKWLSDHWADVEHGFQAIIGVKLIDWGIQAIKMFGDMKTAIVEVIAKLGLLKTAEESAAGASILQKASALGGGIAGKGGAAATGILGLVATVVPVVMAVLAVMGIADLVTELKNSGSKILGMAGIALEAIGGPPVIALVEGYQKLKDVGLIKSEHRPQDEDQSIVGRFKTTPSPGYAAAFMKEVQANLPEKVTDQKAPNLELQKQLAEERLKIAEQEAKQRYEIISQELKDEQAALKSRYEVGLIDLNTYLNQEKELYGKELLARKQQIETDRKNKIDELRQNATQIINGVPTQLVPPELEALKEKAVNDAAKEQQIQAENQFSNQVNGILFQRLQDAKAAYKTYQQDVIQLQKQSLDAQQKMLEEHFKNGLISADDYLAKRRVLIEEERDAVLAELQQELAESGKSEEEKAKITVQEIETRVQAERQLTELTIQEGEIRLQGLENQYQRLHEFLVAQQQIATAAVGTGAPGAEAQSLQVNKELLDLDEAQLKKLTEMLQTQEKGSKQWFDTVKQVGAVNQEITQLNEKIRAATDLARPLAGLFGELSKQFGNTNTGRFFGQLSSTMSQLSEFSKFMKDSGGVKGLGGSFMSLFRKTPAEKAPGSELDQFNAKVKSAGDKFAESIGSTINKVKALADTAAQGMKDLSNKWTASVNDSSQKLAGVINGFSDRLTPAVQAVNNFTDAANAAADKLRGQQGGGGKDVSGTGDNDSVDVTATQDEVQTQQSELPTSIEDTKNANTELADSTSKAASGMSNFAAKLSGFIDKLSGWAQGIGAVANAILGSKSTKGGIFAGGMAGLKFGAQFGPMGAVIGTAVGATLGGIVGHKAAQVQKQMEDIKTHLKGIQDNLANGTTTLGGSIEQLKALRASTMASLGSSKKGSKQLPPILQAINDQINQLLAEQKKTLTELHNQLAILLEPTQYQDILNNLSQIVEKYQQFASAATGNAQEMTAANQWLVASLKAYAQTMSDEVRSANEQAIQDKQKLLDLQDQMNQLTQQEYDILTQGVLTRQRPTAMIKGAQIEQVEEQKQQLKVETDLQQTKVDAEQKMFNLASDRLGLEKQMAALQAQDISEQMAKIAAMEQSLAKLNAALGAGGTLPAGLFDSTGGVNIQALEQLLGLPITSGQGGTGPGGTTGKPTLKNVPPIYQEFIDTIDASAGHQNFGANLLAAAATPFKSAQREAILNILRTSDIGKLLVDAGLVTKPVHGVSTDPNWIDFFGWIDNIMTVSNPGTTQGTVPTPTLPGLDTGGYVQETGTAIVHKGEVVLNAGQVAQPILKNPLQTGIGDKLTSQWQLQTHQQIMTLAQNRIGMETRLLQMQKEQATLEMERIAMLSDLLKQTSSSTNGGSLLENQLSALYGVRGRYGSASFRREIL